MMGIKINKLVLFSVSLLLLSLLPTVSASTFETKCTFERWDGETIPCNTATPGDEWPYKITSNATHHNITRMGESLLLPIFPGVVSYDFQKFKISPTITVPAKNNFNSLSVSHNTTHRYLVITDTMHNDLTRFWWDEKYTVRDSKTFPCTSPQGVESICQDYATMQPSEGFFEVVENELRFYFTKSYINDNAREYPIVMQFDSFVLNGTAGWGGVFTQTNLDENESIMLDLDNTIFEPYISYWTMDRLNSTGGIQDENATNRNDAAILSPTDDVGWRNRSRNFDGGSDYLEVLDSASLDITGNLHVSMRINFNNIDSGNWNVFIDKRNTGAPFYGFWMGLTNADVFRVVVRDNTDTAHAHTSSITPVAGRWYKLDMVYNGSHLFLYVDGNESSTVVGSFTLGTNNKNLWIGKSSFNEHTNASIDEVLISDVAPTINKIISDFNNSYYRNGNFTTDARTTASNEYLFNVSVDFTLDGTSSVNLFLNNTDTEEIENLCTGCTTNTNYSPTLGLQNYRVIVELINGSTPHISEIFAHEGVDGEAPNVTSMDPQNNTAYSQGGTSVSIDFGAICTVNVVDGCDNGTIAIWNSTGQRVQVNEIHDVTEAILLNGSSIDALNSLLTQDDGNYLEVSEKGPPGSDSDCLQAVFNISNVPTGAHNHTIDLVTRYSGVGHVIQWHWMNFTSGQWVEWTTQTASAQDQQFTSSAINWEDSINNSDSNFSIMANHSGNTCSNGHVLRVDMLYIQATTANINYINGVANVTVELDSLGSPYLWLINATDTSANVLAAPTFGNYTFTITATAPNVPIVIQPYNITYTAIESIPLRVSLPINETDLDTWIYSINGDANVSFIENSTLFNQVNNDTYSIRICFNRTNGLFNCTTRYYSLDYNGSYWEDGSGTQPPSIISTTNAISTDMGAIALALLAFMFAFIGMKFNDPETRPIQVGSLMISLYFGAVTAGFITSTNPTVAVAETSLIGMNIIVEMGIFAVAGYLIWKVIELLSSTGMDNEDPFSKKGTNGRR